ncbi:MAG: hypothetical protein FWD15_03455 [Alphaproteobacteria bacterium]|nr:hypothetical protein [Alphaproteobacteria bacterium]
MNDSDYNPNWEKPWLDEPEGKPHIIKFFGAIPLDDVGIKDSLQKFGAVHVCYVGTDGRMKDDAGMVCLECSDRGQCAHTAKEEDKKSRPPMYDIDEVGCAFVSKVYEMAMRDSRDEYAIAYNTAIVPMGRNFNRLIIQNKAKNPRKQKAVDVPFRMNVLFILMRTCRCIDDVSIAMTDNEMLQRIAECQNKANCPPPEAIKKPMSVQKREVATRRLEKASRALGRISLVAELAVRLLRNER